jgi:hypothetical protein
MGYRVEHKEWDVVTDGHSVSSIKEMVKTEAVYSSEPIPNFYWTT